MEKFVLGNSGYDPTIRTENDRILARFGHLNIIVDAITELQEIPPGSGIASVTGNIVNNEDPLNPVVNIKHNKSLSGTGSEDEPLQVTIATDSGLWEPTIDNPEVIFETGSYTQIGDIVTAAFSGRLNLPPLSTSGDFTFSLPVEPANNFEKGYDVTGLINVHTNTSLIESQYVYASIGAVTCFAKLRSNSPNANFSVYIQYNAAN